MAIDAGSTFDADRVAAVAAVSKAFTVPAGAVRCAVFSDKDCVVHLKGAAFATKSFDIAANTSLGGLTCKALKEIEITSRDGVVQLGIVSVIWEIL